MTDNQKKRNQKSSSGSKSPNDNLEIDYMIVEYDVTPEQAREVIRVCGSNKRGDIDSYLRNQERSVSSSRGQGGSGRQHHDSNPHSFSRGAGSGSGSSAS